MFIAVIITQIKPENILELVKRMLTIKIVYTIFNLHKNALF